MKTRILLPVLLILSAMLLSPVSVYASSTQTIHFNGKAALAILPLNEMMTELLLIAVGEGMINLPGPAGPLKGMGIAILFINLSDVERPITLIHAKELAPDEFRVLVKIN